MVEDIFKGAGKKIVIEEFLEGVEASISIYNRWKNYNSIYICKRS